MKQVKLILAVLCAAICICVLTVAASAAYPYGDSIYVSASGASSGSGNTPEAPVTLSRAQTLVSAYTWDGTLNVYISGTVSVASGGSIGGKSHVTYRGVDGTTPTMNIAGSVTVNGDIAFEDLTVNTSNNTDVNLYTMGHDVEVGAGVTGFIGTISTGNLYGSGDQKNITKDMDDPWVVTIRSGGSASSPIVKRYALARGAQTFTGHAILNLEDGSAIDTIHRSAAGPVTYYGIEEVNIKNGSTLNYFFNEHVGGTVQHGLRYIRFDTPNVPDNRFWLYGNNSSAANTGDTGVIVFEIGPNANGNALTASSGIANESELTHVFIYNNNDAAKAKNQWYNNFPHRYGFQVDGTGTVSAYMSTLPTAENDYACELGGIQFTSNYSHAVINGDTANAVRLADLTDGKYDISNFTENHAVYTITFADLDPEDTVKSGYVADSETAGTRTYAIVASFLVSNYNNADIAQFGAYCLNSANEEITVASADRSELVAENGRYNVLIYDIPSADTDVIVIPFMNINGTIYRGATRTLHAADDTAGADNIYYGTEAEVENYFS